MMKQPAGNANATEDDLRSTQERNRPLSRDPDQQEIAAVARQLWMERGGTGGSPEQDWFRAVELVRSRRAAIIGTPSAGGNPSPVDESYVRGTGATRTVEPEFKETKLMENMSGTTDYTGTQTGSTGGVMDRARQTADRARSTVEQYMEDQPKSFPRPEHREGRLARSIEQQTAKLPSDTWLWAAVGSMGLSLALELAGKEKTANFVGHWAPTLLIFGLYNKMVKLQGSDGL